jgi:hypothetical protein
MELRSCSETVRTYDAAEVAALFGITDGEVITSCMVLPQETGGPKLQVITSQPA